MADADDWPDEAEDDPSDQAVTLDAGSILRKLDRRSAGAATADTPSDSSPTDTGIRPELPGPSGWLASSPSLVPAGDDEPEVEPTPSRSVRAEELPASPNMGRPAQADAGSSGLVPISEPMQADAELALDLRPNAARPGEGLDWGSDEWTGRGSFDAGPSIPPPFGGPGPRSPNRGSAASPTIAIGSLIPTGADETVEMAPGRAEPHPAAPEAGIWEMNRAGASVEFSGSQHGVSAEDLLKTNELLRQLVEETKRQRVASLPAAGPSVYPGR